MNRKILVTFLGRVPRSENGYRTTRYDFGDGEQVEPVAFFGWALQRRLRADLLVVLGTGGSMWDHLFEGDLDLGDTAEQQREALIEACASQSVTQQQLDALAPALAQHLDCGVRLEIIPYGRSQAEQMQLLQQMAGQVAKGDRVHLDITHGFRHLPMLALLSALHLRLARGAHVDGIWYGTFDPDTGEAPVHELSGLLRIADGLQALSRFDKDGDYGSFLPLLQQAGASADGIEALRRASFFENILNVGAATGELRQARQKLDASTLAPDAALLLPAMEERLSWISEKKQFEKQLQLGRQRLAARDYLRAVLYAYEAVITRLCQQEREEVASYERRERARQDYEKRLRHERNREHDDYQLLKSLRNQVAHGTRGSRAEVQSTLADESRLRAALDGLLKAIEEGRLPSAPQAATAPRQKTR